LRRNRRGDGDEAYDEEIHGGIDATPMVTELAGPEALFERAETRQRIDAAIARLPAPFREVVVLRDIEDLSYKEIADVAGVPIGTVMSRLARGRRLLMSYLAQPESGAGNGM
jgi:RNA polymerase sigma-70 factor (ECF subfamily)